MERGGRKAKRVADARGEEAFAAAMMLRSALATGNADLAKRMMPSGAAAMREAGWLPLEAACSWGRRECARALIGLGEDPFERAPGEGAERRSPFLAAALESPDCLDEILASPKAKAAAERAEVLMEAWMLMVRSGAPAALAGMGRLAGHGLGPQALGQAAACGLWAIALSGADSDRGLAAMGRLIDCGWSPNAGSGRALAKLPSIREAWGWVPSGALRRGLARWIGGAPRGISRAGWGSEYGGWRREAKLRASGRADPGRREASSLEAAMEMGQWRAAALLVRRGADPDAEVEAGVRPLMLAAAAGQAELVSELLAAGADVARADHAGRTALMWGSWSLRAASGGRGGCARALLAAGADPTVRGEGGWDAIEARLANEDLDELAELAWQVDTAPALAKAKGSWLGRRAASKEAVAILEEGLSRWAGAGLARKERGEIEAIASGPALGGAASRRGPARL